MCPSQINGQATIYFTWKDTNSNHPTPKTVPVVVKWSYACEKYMDTKSGDCCREKNR